MYLDIGLQVVEAHPLFPYVLEKRLAIPTSHLLVNVFSVSSIIYTDTNPIILPYSLAHTGKQMVLCGCVLITGSLMP